MAFEKSLADLGVLCVPRVRTATFGLITDGGIDMRRGSKRTDWKLVQVLEDVYSLGVGFERMPWSVN